MGGRGSLARQLLGWQLAIVFALLGCVVTFSVIQTGKSFADTEGRRLLSVAENVAATPGVRVSLADPVNRDPLPIFAESARSLSGADSVIIAAPDRRVLTSPDPRQLRGELPLGASTVEQGRAWVGEVDGYLVAHVPVIGDGGRIIGIVAAGTEQPGFFEGIANSPGNALALLGIATVIGVAGSVLVTWRVKRQTLGLEPREITGLVEHREALLHGIKEGVLALDEHHRITLVNDKARELLALPGDSVGAQVTELDLNERLRDVLTGRAHGTDQIVLRAGRVLVMNRMPISRDGRVIGAVVTLRDRTELVALREELAANSRATDTLRAQAHEFTNRLHTIAGLIELGEYAEVRNYVDLVSRAHGEWHDQVTGRIEDPAVAALLIAKASLAAEQGVGLRLTEGSRLAAVDERLSADLVTVVGNLVDNALDALRALGGGSRDGSGDWIEVEIRQTDAEVSVVVRDSGPGVAPEIVTEVFAHGFTTKAAEDGGPRGLGLAITRQICRRRGGTVRVHNAECSEPHGGPGPFDGKERLGAGLDAPLDGGKCLGAVFTAVLPYARAGAAR
ncbi:Sensor histidine kinase regulating citrate/malate metabolism [Amycolatopsis arida]|uniref:histidine kinase n=1 Tax=Amycolatopsis arida TaxID=587909 RepID=A0A1I5SWU7_9PSEU|nr:sensor histidine kinase [Amycolatopsis arida]TDX96316.1 sensor histidine kinase regulating citrate/malate metabolism [Amycolatopsis arida]SFP75255.1 Sensor histidine kinase regulating citrate/malate metabolism [Amycolatopsis arida]